jgi:hypothetical protein
MMRFSFVIIFYHLHSQVYGFCGIISIFTIFVSHESNRMKRIHLLILTIALLLFGGVATFLANATCNGTGTVGDDIINCDFTPIPPTIDAGAGNDIININVGGVAASVNGSTGNDVITINGTVNGDVDAGDNNDNIIINGEVGGDVTGWTSDDVITIEDGVDGGADNTLNISGAFQTDTLVFSMTIDLNSFADEATYAALLPLIASDAASGTITYRGQTLNWDTFEDLVDMLTIIPRGSGGTVVSITVARDGRLNPNFTDWLYSVYNRDWGGNRGLFILGSNDGGFFIPEADLPAIGDAPICTASGDICVWRAGNGDIIIDGNISGKGPSSSYRHTKHTQHPRAPLPTHIGAARCFRSRT